MTRRMEPDTDLLNLMVEDCRRADPRWQATTYWRDLASQVTDFLRDPENLVNFRRAPMRTGIRSYRPGNPGRFPRPNKKGEALIALLRRVPVVRNPLLFYQAGLQQIISEHDQTFDRYVETQARLLGALYGEDRVLPDFQLGNPDDGVEVDGNYYSIQSLWYQSAYLQATRHLDFNGIHSLIEVGSGYGGQMEVVLRHHADLRCVAVDIPPWLYVAEIYLRAAFPGQVVGYREVRDWTGNCSALQQMGERRILIMGSWQWPILRDTFDLVWNARSVQEMDEQAEPCIRRMMARGRNLLLHTYLPGKPGIHSHAQLRQWVQDAGGFSLVADTEDPIARPRGQTLIFSRIKKEGHVT